MTDPTRIERSLFHAVENYENMLKEDTDNLKGFDKAIYLGRKYVGARYVFGSKALKAGTIVIYHLTKAILSTSNPVTVKKAWSDTEVRKTFTRKWIRVGADLLAILEGITGAILPSWAVSVIKEHQKRLYGSNLAVPHESVDMGSDEVMDDMDAGEFVPEDMGSR